MDKHASLKKRYPRANQKDVIDRELNQAILVTSRLEANS